VFKIIRSLNLSYRSEFVLQIISLIVILTSEFRPLAGNFCTVPCMAEVRPLTVTVYNQPVLCQKYTFESMIKEFQRRSGWGTNDDGK